MKIAAMPMPGALRLRTLHPLIDGDGSCSLIYDLERGQVIDVPEELQFHVAPALETGNPDEDLMSWLAGEDLLTSDGWGAHPGGEAETSALLEMPCWWKLGSIHRQDGEIHSRIEQASEETVFDALDFVFKQSLGASRVTLHLVWAGTCPCARLLERIVVEANRRAAARRQEVRFELALDASAVTPALAASLAGMPYRVRLHCGSFPSLEEEGAERDRESRAWGAAESAVLLLRGVLGDRLTVQCVLAGRSRLLELWSWAKELGVRHLDAVRMEGISAWGMSPPQPSELRAYRGDLRAVAGEIAADLEAGRRPIDFQPVTRVVRRLMRSGAMARLAPELPFAGSSLPPMVSLGDVFAAPGSEAASWLVGDLWPAFEEREPAAGADEEEGASPCHGCWARFACSRSCLSASPADAQDRREPSPDRCAVWRTEVEAALRLYHGFVHVDPLRVLAMFEETAPAASPRAAEPRLWGNKAVF